GTAALCASWPGRCTTIGPRPTAPSTRAAWPCWPTRWRRPAAPTPRSWGTAESRVPTTVGAGWWTGSWARREETHGDFRRVGRRPSPLGATGPVAARLPAPPRPPPECGRHGGGGLCGPRLYRGLDRPPGSRAGAGGLGGGTARLAADD